MAGCCARCSQGTEGALISPHSGTGDAAENDPEAAANPTDFLLVLAPVYNDQGPQGVVEVFQRPGARIATQRGYLRFLLQICEFAGDYLKGRPAAASGRQANAVGTARNIHAHRTREARRAARRRTRSPTKGRRLIGCDRVSVAIRHGGKCRIEAVSGQDTFDKRSNVTVLLGKLADGRGEDGRGRAGTRATRRIWRRRWKRRSTPTSTSRTPSRWRSCRSSEPGGEVELAPDEVARPPPRVIGALIVEQMVDTRAPDGFRQRVDVVRTHSASALTNALEYEGLFLMPVWRAIGKTTRWLFGPALPKTLAISALVAGGDRRRLPGADRFHARRRRQAAAEGAAQRVCHARRRGAADPGRGRLAGEEGPAAGRARTAAIWKRNSKPSAASWRQTEAEIALDARASRSTTTRTSSENDRNQQEAQLSQLEENAISLRKQLELLDRAAASCCKSRSPIDGQVVEWRLHENAARPAGEPRARC